MPQGMIRTASFLVTACVCAFSAHAARAQDAADFVTRLNRLEGMLRDLTGQVEQARSSSCSTAINSSHSRFSVCRNSCKAARRRLLLLPRDRLRNIHHRLPRNIRHRLRNIRRRSRNTRRLLPGSRLIPRPARQGRIQVVTTLSIRRKIRLRRARRARSAPARPQPSRRRYTIARSRPPMRPAAPAGRASPERRSIFRVFPVRKAVVRLASCRLRRPRMRAPPAVPWPHCRRPIHRRTNTISRTVISCIRITSRRPKHSARSCTDIRATG
jgi:hypothetical protein